MLGSSIQEFLMLAVIIMVMSFTGVWPMIVRGMRQLRGEPTDDLDPPQPSPGHEDMTLSYQLLGLAPSATWDEVERAYRQKAKLHHPDHGGDEDTMRAVNEAYARIKQWRGPQRGGR